MRDVGRRTRITLLTDFGTADGYVAAMRGVIAEIAPDVMVEDASHDVAPGDVRAAAFALERYWRLYPAGTVHVVVVDPGVGTDRRALIVEADDRLAVGPDNGVLTPMLVQARVVREVTSYALFRRSVSDTFHGRDVFAPVAAWLASGGSPDLAGPPADSPFRLPAQVPTRIRGGVTGEIVHVDRFGNLITNVPAAWIGAGWLVNVDGHDIGSVKRTYSDAVAGGSIALIGSGGFLEISVRDGSAAERLSVGRGGRVRVAAPEAGD